VYVEQLDCELDVCGGEWEVESVLDVMEVIMEERKIPM